MGERLFEGIDEKFAPYAGAAGVRFSLVRELSLDSISVDPELADWRLHVIRRNGSGRNSAPPSVTRVLKTYMLTICLGSRVSVTRYAG